LALRDVITPLLEHYRNPGNLGKEFSFQLGVCLLKERELNERLQDVTGKLGSAKKVHRKGKNIPLFLFVMLVSVSVGVNQIMSFFCRQRSTVSTNDGILSAKKQIFTSYRFRLKDGNFNIFFLFPFIFVCVFLHILEEAKGAADGAGAAGAGAASRLSSSSSSSDSDSSSSSSSSSSSDSSDSEAG
jgi:hypothetical protein